MQDNNNSNTSKQLILQGLDCAGCAAKIEKRINSLKEVDEAILNFSTSTLTIKFTEENNWVCIEEKVKDIVNSLEPDVVVKEKLAGRELAFHREHGKCHKSGCECHCTHKHHVVGEHTENCHYKFHSHNHERVEGKANKTELIKILIGIIIFLVAYFGKFSKRVEIIMYLLSYIFIGADIALRALRNIFKGEVFDENFLMFIATVGAFSIGEFPEAVFVMLFYKVGEAFQDKAVNNSRKSIASLMDIRPEMARLKIGEEFKEVFPEEVNVDDIILVKPGEKIPLDGIIIEGESMVNTSDLTGESLPKKVVKGEQVLSGFINGNGVLTLKVSKNFSESAVSKILDLVENAGAKKAPTEQFITKFARYYTPIVVFSALALAFLPPLFIPGAKFVDWLKRSLIFLVVSCPCALVISVPLGFFAGIGNASKKGILIKGGNYLEALNNVDTIVFDKTGTLTEGTFAVTNIKTNGHISTEELLEFASYAEIYSNHPIANSIRSYYGKEIDKTLIKDYEEIAGKGVKAKVKGQEVLAGNYKLMKFYDINFNVAKEVGTVVYIAVSGEFLGYIVISDKIKKDSVSTITQLKNIGIKNIIMLTGDNKTVAENISNQLGVDKVYSELLPKDKVEIFENHQENLLKGKKSVFVGDGVNDAPVLTRADVGIAMGALGADAAIEAADIVLMTDEPSKVVTAINISRFTRKIVTQNIVFALGVKLLVLSLGAFGLANMWQAVFADVGVAVIAIFNSMRILKYKG